MKKFLILALLAVLISPSIAAIYDPFDMLRGKQMVPYGSLWSADDAVMYFGDGKDASLKFNSTSGYLEMVGLTAYDNTSITVESGEDITFAGGDSAADFHLGSGLFKTSTGAVTIGPGAVGLTGTMTVATTKDIIAASTGSDFDFSASTDGIFKTPGGAVTIGPGAIAMSGSPTVATGKTLAVVDADKLTVGSVIVPQEMVINVPITTSEPDQTIFIADDAWQITKIEEVHATAQNTAFPNTGSATIMKCTGTQAAASGSVMHNTSMYLNNTVETVQTPTLNAATGALALADGNRLALNINGTMTTFANGVITIHMKRV